MKALLQTMQALTASTGVKYDHIDVQDSLSKYLLCIERKVQNEGKTRACEYFKQLHFIATAKIVKSDTLPIIPFCKTDKYGLPKELKPLKVFILSDDANLQRIGLTITRTYGLLVLPTKWNPDPITDQGPNLDPNFLKKFNNFCESWTSRLGIKGRNLQEPERVVSRMVRGPNGPAIITAHYDARAVVNDTNFASKLGALSVLTRTKWIYDLMLDCAKDTKNNNYKIGRIALIAEGGGKTRTVAIGNYWTQNILQGIHDLIMNILRKMVTDGTYGQEEQVKRISNLSLGHKTYSYDLTSATDRFPIVLQEILLSHVLPKGVSAAWKDVMSLHPFNYNNDIVRWKVGQPLGLMSSWAAFSLTHHAFIEYCAYLKGYKSFKDYAVLGDDVVIWNETVAIQYKDLLEEMGLTINLNKSLISDDKVHRVEFAKRIILNGTEISGLAPDVLKQANTLYGYVDLIRLARMRSWNLPWVDIIVPPNHSVKWSGLLEVLLFDASYGTRAPSFLKGNTQNTSDDVYKQLKSKIVELRIQSLRKKQDSIDKVLTKAKPVEDLFKGEGITVSARLIGLEGWNPNPHPIIWAVNQAGEDMMYALSALESLPNDGPIPELVPVEYLPIPMIGSYFGSHFQVVAKKHSTFVLKAWLEIIQATSVDR